MRKRGKQELTLLRAGGTRYPKRPDEAKLEWFSNNCRGRRYRVELETVDPVTSVCPVTGQPDFGKITISYVPDKRLVESKSLKLYLGSFRNCGTFSEDLVNRIATDLVRLLDPVELDVVGEFQPRGGIAIGLLAHYTKRAGWVTRASSRSKQEPVPGR